MKVWWARDRDGNRAVFTDAPDLSRYGNWLSMRGCIGNDRQRDARIRWFLNRLFPRNIKPGQCKMVPLRRAGEK